MSVRQRLQAFCFSSREHEMFIFASAFFGSCGKKALCGSLDPEMEGGALLSSAVFRERDLEAAIPT